MPDRPDIPEEAVEAAAEALWNEREYRDPTGPPPDDWCPPGHEVEARPPSEPALWAPMVEAGEYPSSQEETRADARAALQAAAPTLRKQGAEEERARLREAVKRPVDLLAKELHDLSEDEITTAFTMLDSGETVQIGSLIAEAADLLAALDQEGDDA